MREIPYLAACLGLAACSPLGDKPEVESEADWPTILEAEPTDPAPILAAERERPYERHVREATDLWVGNDRSLRAEITPLADLLEADGVLAGWGTGTSPTGWRPRAGMRSASSPPSSTAWPRLWKARRRLRTT